MGFLNYFIAIVVGFFIGCFPLLMSVIICRVGISLCNEMKKDEECDIHTKNILDFQLKRYYFSLLIQLFMICLVTVLCYLFLKEEFLVYLMVVAIICKNFIEILKWISKYMAINKGIKMYSRKMFMNYIYESTFSTNKLLQG